MPRFSSKRTPAERTVVFADFHHLHAHLTSTQDDGDAAQTGLALLGDVRRYLSEGGRTRVDAAHAYADFVALGDDGAQLQQGLLDQGMLPHFVRLLGQPDATDAIAFDAYASACAASPPDTLVFVTASRPLATLVERVQATGRDAVVVYLVPPPDLADLPQHLRECYLDARELAGPGLRKRLDAHAKPPDAKPKPRRAEDRPPVAATPPRPKTQPVEGDLERQTLEIIEEHFGQYEEVYLTPLLRKLSETYGEEGDPKEVVSTLEDLGAVWLEKRRGFPHDYTVLLVNVDHPDVQEISAAFDEDDVDDYDEDFDEDDFDDVDADFDEDEDFADDDFDDEADYVEQDARSLDSPATGF